MSDHVFKSKYSMEEIENNFKDVDFFSSVNDLQDKLKAWT